jgi:hypothetical protein
LAIVHRIINDHNGQIRVASREPKGTTVVIDLPTGEPAAVKISSEQSEREGEAPSGLAGGGGDVSPYK